MNLVNNVIVYKVSSQRGSWLFTDYDQATKKVEDQMKIQPKAWVKNIETYEPGQLQQSKYFDFVCSNIQWVNKAIQRPS